MSDEADDPEHIDESERFEIEMALVHGYGPDLDFDPRILDVEQRTFHTVRQMRQAQLQGGTRAVVMVAGAEFGDAQREAVIDAFEGVEGVGPGPEDDDAEYADIREILGDFFDAGLMDNWSAMLRRGGAWMARPLSALCGHVLTAPIRKALAEHEQPHLPRVASHIAFVANGREAVRVRKRVDEALEGAAVSIDRDATQTQSIADMLGPLSADDADEIVEPGDEGFEVPDALRRF